MIETIRDCPCDDGARRHVTVTGPPQENGVTPAFVELRGARVDGFVIRDADGPTFHFYLDGPSAK